jgi:hypothetical protein
MMQAYSDAKRAGNQFNQLRLGKVDFPVKFISFLGRLKSCKDDMGRIIRNVNHPAVSYTRGCPNFPLVTVFAPARRYSQLI